MEGWTFTPEKYFFAKKAKDHRSKHSWAFLSLGVVPANFWLPFGSVVALLERPC
jgi:hypothetical protein